MITLLFHPGDLGLTEWAIILLVACLLIAMPIFIVVFVIYKVATRGRDEFQTGITKKDSPKASFPTE
jgi:hypothetical protein